MARKWYGSARDLMPLWGHKYKRSEEGQTVLIEGVRLAEVVLFAAVSAHCIRSWRLRGGAATGWLAVVFATLTALIASGSVVGDHRGSPALEVYWHAVVVGILVLPYCLHRFTSAFRPGSRIFETAASVSTAVLVAASLFLPNLPPSADRPPWVRVFVLSVVAFWTTLAITAAWRLWNEGRGRRLIERRRMTTLAVGSLIINVGILLLVLPPRSETVTLTIQILGLCSGLLIFIGFVVPAPFRARWRRAETQAFVQAQAELMSATTWDAVAAVVLPRATDLVGGDAAVLVHGEDRTVVSYGQGGASLVAHVPEGGFDPGTIIEDQEHIVTIGLHGGWLAVRTPVTAPFFGRQELDLFSALGRLLDLALARAALFDELGQTCRDLAEGQRQLAEAQAVAHLGSYEWNPEDHSTTWSAEMQRMLQIPSERVGDLGAFVERVHPDDRARVLAAFKEAGAGAAFALEYRIVLDDGEVRVIRGSGRTMEQSTGRRVVGIIQDVTDSKVAEERVEYQARHDSLTGLPNRAHFLSRLDDAIQRQRRGGERSAVLFLDLDHFKSVNDELGHPAGDQVLVGVAARLREIARPGDTVARLGGDEFVMLAEDVPSTSDAVALGERIVASLNSPIVVDRRQAGVTASIGVALTDEEADAESVLRDADLAMYRAKEMGRARVELFDKSHREELLTRVEIGRSLRRGIDNDELFLEFQPSVSLTTDEVTGVEALVRWKHPTRGLLQPHEFVPVAEQSDLVLSLGQWVLRAACAAAVELRARHGSAAPTVWVNVSAQQLHRPGLADFVAAALEESGLPGTHLGLELTETALIGSAATADEELDRLRALGVSLALDDFGTGFSSLSYLRRFRVDVLKIDRSFVAGLGEDAEDSAIVSACVALAHSLGLPTVAGRRGNGRPGGGPSRTRM